jgi:asparagine synthase (glutamine-hydrolysing)
MCGISGIINNKETINRKDLIRINNKLSKRGPDAEGYFFKKNFGLAMKRLSIIDIKNGNQPIKDTHGNQLICNGEIYNYLELKRKYFPKAKFSTNSDCEIILHLYLKFGIKSLKFLNGMFAFCIWDNRKNFFFIARDRFGMKPLYYYKNKKKFIFSSTSNSIVKSLDIKFDIDETQVYNYLLYGYIPSPNSIWKNIKKLKPYNYITIDKNFNIKIKDYKYLDNANYDKESYDNILLENFKIHTRSDVKIGSMLSGGADSSLVTAYSNNVKKLSDTFIAQFKGKKISESTVAKKNSKLMEIKTNLIKVNMNQVKKNFDNIIYSLDEPISDSAIISTFLLTKKANEKKIKVLLSGAGGDELFGGYKRYEVKKYKFTKNLNSAKSVNLLIKIIRLLPTGKYSNFILKSFNLGAAYVSSIAGIDIDVLCKYARDTEKLSNSITNINAKFKSIDRQKLKQEFMQFDKKNYLVDNILSLSDQISMYNSVEIRLPLLGNVFYNKIKKLKEFNKDFIKKIIHEQFNLKLIKTKTGFNAPIDKWIENPFFANKKKKLNHKILNKILKISRIKNDFFQNKQFIFSLIVLNEWLEKNAK